MTLSDARDLFGATFPYLVAGAVVVAVSLLLAAFAQGREVSFWPPRFGARPPRAVEDGAAGQLPAARAPAVRRYDREYDTEHAREFYQEIAGVYDSRNSDRLVKTHLLTLDWLRQLRADHPAMRVLDLGGGTGSPIATHFFHDRDVEWTYVDFTPQIADAFQRTLANTPLIRKATVERGDLVRVCGQLRHRQYDVVLLSLVLTSMPALPDFREIVPLVAPGGSLIITDIGPGYTKLKPYYEVTVGERVVALRMVPVDPVVVAKRVNDAGLATTAITPLDDADPYYSFVATFTAPPVRPPDDGHRNRGLRPSRR